MPSWIAKLLLQLIANFAVLEVAINYIPGVGFSGTFLQLARAAAVITVLNVVLKPFVQFILAPFVFLTLGLFSIVINAALLWLATYWAPQLTFSSVKTLLIASLAFAFVNFLFHTAQQSHT